MFEFSFYDIPTPKISNTLKRIILQELKFGMLLQSVSVGLYDGFICPGTWKQFEACHYGILSFGIASRNKKMKFVDWFFYSISFFYFER
jgi:hypothetical protein